jgi:hypothetical protein
MRETKCSLQGSALNDIKYLMDAAENIHRATDGDGLWTIFDYEKIGWDCHAEKWTEKANHPDTKAALDIFNWLLYDHSEYGGHVWADHCGPLKKAFRDIVREAKKRITDTDWTPCNCQYCRKHRATRNKK